MKKIKAFLDCRAKEIWRGVLYLVGIIVAYRLFGLGYTLLIIMIVALLSEFYEGVRDENYEKGKQDGIDAVWNNIKENNSTDFINKIKH